MPLQKAPHALDPVRTTQPPTLGQVLRHRGQIGILDDSDRARLIRESCPGGFRMALVSPAHPSGRYHRYCGHCHRFHVSIPARSDERRYPVVAVADRNRLRVSIPARSDERAIHIEVEPQGAELRVSIPARSDERAIHGLKGSTWTHASMFQSPPARMSGRYRRRDLGIALPRQAVSIPARSDERAIHMAACGMQRRHS